MEKQRGLLLVNLGTPSATTTTAIKRYLSEFLHDRHVVDLNPLFWYPLLHGFILPKRTTQISKHYKKIWIEDSSPLLYYSKLLLDKLQKKLPDVACELAMTYGEPSIVSALEKLQQCKDVTILPLFPQYSTTTTQAMFDKIAKISPASTTIYRVNFIRDYAENPSYINALYLQVIQAFLAQGEPELLLLSYHGIPMRYISERADSYKERCEITTQLLIQKLKETGIQVPVKMAYQSKFGRGKWTTPSTSDVLKELAMENVTNVQVMCPGFAVDCLETIYEIDEQNRDIFFAAGGEKFYYIPSLNDSDLHVNLLLDIINNTETL